MSVFDAHFRPFCRRRRFWAPASLETRF